ncbi:hypothetical protein [uncultured Methanofollis sp.]|uniref:hypothetical protein n=1 Tax=uncultured Methanofollis sp. TaxID=262500 RepID=UPI002612BE72|nr:hypothetical protein [uncultured Methanofollis sp.]
MKGKLMIGAALLLCLALVAVAPAVAWGGAGGFGGVGKAAWQNSAQENVSAGTCPCGEDGTCQQYQFRGQSRDGTCTGAGVCDQTRTCQRICWT